VQVFWAVGTEYQEMVAVFVGALMVVVFVWAVLGYVAAVAAVIATAA